MSEADLDDRLRRIRAVILDVDGVLTAGGLTFDSKGTEYKTFNVHDGYGLKSLQDKGVVVGVITGRESTIVSDRTQELNIHHVMQGSPEKGSALTTMLKGMGVQPAEALYIGDDVPDLPAMQLAGVAVAVANAVEVVREQADWVTARKGGEGAVREVCDRLCAILR